MAERSRSVEAVLKMRMANQESNSDRVYDMITLSDGKRAVVFFAAQRKKSSGGINRVGKGRGKKSKKALQKNLLSTARGSREEVVKVRFDVSHMHHEHIRLRRIRSCSIAATSEGCMRRVYFLLYCIYQL